MMNVLRLSEGVEMQLFSEATGLNPSLIQASIRDAVERGLLQPVEGSLCPTPFGFRFLNDLISLFQINE
jgi:oxygen-independent coproporphyrinogen-3 oxidase